MAIILANLEILKILLLQLGLLKNHVLNGLA